MLCHPPDEPQIPGWVILLSLTLRHMHPCVPPQPAQAFWIRAVILWPAKPAKTRTWLAPLREHKRLGHSILQPPKMAGQGKQAQLRTNELQGKQQKGPCTSVPVKDTEQGKWEDRRMAWWVKYLPHEADGLCVTRTQIKVEGNQLTASHLPHEYCVTCAHAPHTE